MGEKAGGLIPSPRTAITIAIIAVLVAATAFTVLALHLLSISSPSCPSTAQVNTLPGQKHFTIIITNQGFNGSRTHSNDPCPWPVMNVKQGDMVTIHVENDDTNGEAHGFAITHYLDSGVKLGPGQSNDVSFTANQAGTFLVYCNIFCTIHSYMQNGQLNITT